MQNLETVERSPIIPSVDPLRVKQNEDVAKMRASLLMCSGDTDASRRAIQDITLSRVYHQLARIIRFTEMMDRIEDKLYEAMDIMLDTIDMETPTAWMVLINMQERLQKNMIDSHKLLAPYLNMEEFGIDEILTVDAEVVDPNALQLNRDSRDKLRTSAQQVLELISNNKLDASELHA